METTHLGKQFRLGDLLVDLLGEVLLGLEGRHLGGITVL